MNILRIKPYPMQLIALTFTTQLLTACMPGEAFFNSGIAKEWSAEKPISREQLIMEPDYYFAYLDKDINRAIWMMSPRGTLMRDSKARQDLIKIRELLQDYSQTLRKLSNGKFLPENQLAVIYADLLNNFDSYLNNEKNMGDINTQLGVIEPQVRRLELLLEDSDSRRLSTLVQTISGSPQ